MHFITIVYLFAELLQIMLFGGLFVIESIIWIKDFKMPNKNLLEAFMGERIPLQDGNFVYPMPMVILDSRLDHYLSKNILMKGAKQT